MESSKAAVRYVSHVRRRLTCSAASRRQLSLRSQELAEQYAEENPDARYDDFVTAFGAPGDFAGELLSSLDSGEVETARKRRTYGKRVCAGFCALVLLASLAFSLYLKTEEKNANVTAKETLIIYTDEGN